MLSKYQNQNNTIWSKVNPPRINNDGSIGPIRLAYSAQNQYKIRDQFQNRARLMDIKINSKLYSLKKIDSCNLLNYILRNTHKLN